MTESVITFSNIARFGNLSTGNKNMLQHIVKVASKIIGVKLPDLSHTFLKRAISKARIILQSPLHHLYGGFELLPSGLRFRLTKARTISQATRLLNISENSVHDVFPM